MIVLDIETSGGDMEKCGIWQIGAIEFENPKNYFLEEAHIDSDDSVEEEALTITGKTQEDLRDKDKQSQKELITHFLEWMNFVDEKDLLCHNPQFDQSFLRIKAKKYFDKDPFWPDLHRAFDLHSIAQMKFFEINKKFLVKEGHSDMGLRNILSFCGMKDNRMRLNGTEVINKGTVHNALEDCKLEGECFSRLMHGENLFPEFSEFEIPDYLKQGGENDNLQ